MSRFASLVPAVCLGTALVAGCALGGEASDDGQAFLINETGEVGLRVVVRRPDEVRQEGGRLEEVYTFDTQWTNRELQCYVESDGYFDVLRPDGSILAHHEFADRQLCEGEEITLQADGALVWSE